MPENLPVAPNIKRIEKAEIKNLNNLIQKKEA